MDKVNEAKIPIFEEFRHMNTGSSWYIDKIVVPPNDPYRYRSLPWKRGGTDCTGLRPITNHNQIRYARELFADLYVYHGEVRRTLSIFNICNN